MSMCETKFTPNSSRLFEHLADITLVLVSQLNLIKRLVSQPLVWPAESISGEIGGTNCVSITVRGVGYGSAPSVVVSKIAEIIFWRCRNGIHVVQEQD